MAARFQSADGFGTLETCLHVTALVNTSGTVVERYVYTPFGVQTVLTAAWGAQGTTLSMAVGYQGERLDSISGLYLFGEREYSPTLLRFTSNDPSLYTLAGDPNLYRALSNSPINHVDPSGLDTVFGYETGYSNTHIRAGGLGRAAMGVEIALAGEGSSPVGGFVLIPYGLDLAYTGTLDFLTGERHTTNTFQLLDQLTGRCISKYEETFETAYNITRLVQSLPSIISGIGKLSGKIVSLSDVLHSSVYGGEGAHDGVGCACRPVFCKGTG